MGRLVFYLVRHGETLFNTRRLAQGWCDSPLTGEGIAQAEALGRGLAEVEFLAAYSSTSERAVDTAELALDGRGLPVFRSKEFREMNFGLLEGEDGKLLFDDFEKRFREGWKDVEGETWEELEERAMRGLEGIARQYGDRDGNILISTHGMTVMQLAKAAGADSAAYREYEASGHRGLDNCSVTLLAWEGGRYELLRVNDTSFRDAGMMSSTTV